MTERLLTRNVGVENSHTIDVYMASGGYKSLERAIKKMTPDEVIEEVKSSNLRGRGGAGFPCGLKWSFMPKESEVEKSLAINADESEPGTFKDRVILENDPHMLIEGSAIAAYALGVKRAYVYVRGEYFFPTARLRGAIAGAHEKGFLGKNIMGTHFDLDIMVSCGAGAYICGEETSLMESVEGKRGYPRLKPPFPTQVGIFGGPTVVNNVETLSCVPHIIERGADWFAALGTEKDGGTRLYGISGHVEKPGVYEMPAGTSLRAAQLARRGRRGRRRRVPGTAVRGPLGLLRHQRPPRDHEDLRSTAAARRAVCLRVDGPRRKRPLRRLISSAGWGLVAAPQNHKARTTHDLRRRGVEGDQQRARPVRPGGRA